MAMTDPLGDMLTRIRNGQRAKKDSVLSPASKLRARVLDVLKREGYIRGYSEDATGAHPQLRIELKYFEGEPAIKHVARVSKPGRRVYSGSKELPVVRNGLGMHTADIHAKGDGAEWLQEALAAELGRHGFVVVTDPGEADYVVDAELSHVHCTAMLTYEGDVTLTASAAQFGQRVAGRSYTGKGSAGMNWSATEKAFQATLNLALQDAVLQFVQELPTRAEAVAVVGRGPS